MDTEQVHEHGGPREGAGRKKGRPSLRRAADAIAEVAAAFPLWSPVLHFATVANDESLPADIRLDAAKAAAQYLHARPKPVEMEPDALVELESRVARARLEAQADALDDRPGFADRLARALVKGAEETALLAATRPIVVNVEREPAPVFDGQEPEDEPDAEPVSAIPGEWEEPKVPEPYRPILPPYPERQTFAETSYELMPGSILSAYSD